MSEMDIEKPADDASEQARDLVETDEETPRRRTELPFDANEADAAEQEITVGNDDDDYR
ncbi:MAG: hypothetical protein JO016_00830 [Actinobacteria bacterium]|nr:hypothetical protein [Actinomycetota bacterium]